MLARIKDKLYNYIIGRMLKDTSLIESIIDRESLHITNMLLDDDLFINRMRELLQEKSKWT